MDQAMLTLENGVGKDQRRAMDLGVLSNRAFCAEVMMGQW